MVKQSKEIRKLLLFQFHFELNYQFDLEKQKNENTFISSFLAYLGDTNKIFRIFYVIIQFWRFLKRNEEKFYFKRNDQIKYQKSKTISYYVFKNRTKIRNNQQ